MSDIGRFLPLSQGRGADETAVTGEWSSQAADCLDAVAALLGSLEPSEWDTLAGPEQWRVAASAGHLAERSAAALRTPLADAVRTMAMNDLSGFVAFEALGRMTRAGAEAVVGVLRRIAAEFRAPPAESSDHTRWTGKSKLRRQSLRVLTDIVVTGYDIADAVDRQIEFPAVATGAVALARVGAAPAAIRAVTRGRTLTATDAGWSFGHGPELAGTASDIVRFLFERAGVPQAPAP